MTHGSSTKVVITGMAVVSPLGNSLAQLWDALASRRSGVRSLRLADGSYATAMGYGAPAADFRGDIADFGDLDKERSRAIRKGLKLMCREIQMGVAVAQLGMQHARLVPGSFDPERTGVVYGCDHVVTDPEEFAEGIQACMGQEEGFSFDRWATQGLPKVTPLWLLKYLPNMPASHIAIYNDLQGPNNSITYRESSGNLAIGEAFATIQRGSADCMLAGATGCHIQPLKSLYVCLQNQMASNSVLPEKISRPFDLHRTGQVAGEGAAVLVLETESHALSRGATIYGEVLGHGSAISIDRQGIANPRRALLGAGRAALQSAGITTSSLGHIHAHGLATQHGDREESRAMGDLLGDGRKTIPVVAAKSYFGNLGAAGGIVELICSLLAIHHGALFPILNYETPDPECPLHAVTRSDTPAGNVVLNWNCTPQGQASAVVVRSDRR